MIIAGYDYSVTSPARVLLELDKNLDIKRATYRAFAKNKKQSAVPSLVLLQKDLSGIARYVVQGKQLFSRDPEYVAYEDYAFGASGALTKLAEAAGYSKALHWEEGHKIRLYDIASIKKVYTGRGDSDKVAMWDIYEAGNDYLDLKKDIKAGKLPAVDKGGGVSPTSDIIDAFAIATTLQLELKVRAGIVELKSLQDHQRSIFLRTTTANPINLLDRPFECK